MLGWKTYFGVANVHIHTLISKPLLVLDNVWKKLKQRKESYI